MSQPYSPREVVVTRRALHELAYEIPMSRLGPLLGVSDVLLANVYEDHRVGHAYRGDWARRHHGLRPPLARFRPAPPGVPEIVRFGRRAERPADAVDRRDHELIDMLALDADAEPAKVPANVLDAHPLVRRGASLAEREPYLGRRRPAATPVAAIDEAPKSQDSRARCALSALFFAIEARGGRLSVDGRRAVEEVTPTILGVRFKLRVLYVPTRRYRPEPGASFADAERDLVLFAKPLPDGKERLWGQVRRSRLEHRIDGIATAMIAMAAAVRAGLAAEAPGGTERAPGVRDTDATPVPVRDEPGADDPDRATRHEEDRPARSS